MVSDVKHRNRIHDERNNRSVVELLKELRDETTDLVRHEVALAKVEMNEKASRVTRNLVYLAAGAFILHGGFLILLMAASAGVYVGLVAAGLTHMNAGWLAPLIIGAVFAILGYAFVQKAISTLKHESIMPEETIASMRHTKDWAQEKVSTSHG
jgi:cation transport ATPase